MKWNEIAEFLEAFGIWKQFGSSLEAVWKQFGMLALKRAGLCTTPRPAFFQPTAVEIADGQLFVVRHGGWKSLLPLWAGNDWKILDVVVKSCTVYKQLCVWLGTRIISGQAGPGRSKNMQTPVHCCRLCAKNVF